MANKRRTDAEIEEVKKIHDRTNDVARGINDRVGLDDIPIHVRASDYWDLRAQFQQEAADTLVVRFYSKDAAVVERVMAAMKAAYLNEGNR